MSTLHAKVTSYKGLILIELQTQKSIDGEVNTSLDTKDAYGQIIHKTKEHLGVSAEALALLKTLKAGRNEALNDLEWLRTSDGHHSFGWMGGPCRIIDPLDGSVDIGKGYVVPEDYVLIENDVPEGAKEHIDATVKNA